MNINKVKFVLKVKMAEVFNMDLSFLNPSRVLNPRRVRKEFVKEMIMIEVKLVFKEEMVEVFIMDLLF